MSLPADFQFSQSSLQDYVDCPRRFQLRYVQQLAWPAIRAEPPLESERYLQQGSLFHRLVHQHMVGLPAAQLSRQAIGEELSRWWRNYLEYGPSGLPQTRYAEVLLSAPLGGYRLAARYDLIAVEAGERAVIVDWKTLRQRPRRAWLAGRLQTRVYPYLLVRAGREFNGGREFMPEQVEMLYWFTEFPAAPERFVYSAARYQEDERYLLGLVGEIAGLEATVFPLTADERRCRFCHYRSLCRRGEKAGPLDEAGEAEDEEFGLTFDLEQIAEVEY
ncbi:MAG: PD-(D/E)XK nuclease family protein [Anaerolineae bacterium]|nr:PD-(D/E)XK nuclease family protein [Anaerolineae bacterium]